MSEPEPNTESDREQEREHALDRMGMDYPVEFDTPPDADAEEPEE